MADIFHNFPIKVLPDRVFEAVSTPRGLDAWWTKKSSGRSAETEEYKLWFGPEYDWRARVTKCVAPSEFELQILHAHEDWNGTRVGFHLHGGQTTNLSFYHTGWPLANEHWRISSYCWAMYLRILRRYLEHGESVAYEDRLDA
jgi:uncharacterized protein YndB with AHSA1/START domain